MKNARIVILIALALGLIMLLTPVGQAQQFRARVQGIVTDESHAVITNAAVTLLNVNTGIRSTRQTTETGLYLFDGVDPGTYSVAIEIAGFNKFVQENVLVQSGGDVTVNATLKPGSVQTTVTITETPAAVDFNTSNKDITLDTKMVAEIPRIDRNPFKLTLLAPSAINTRGEMQPYHSWAANSVDLGGGTNLKNDLEVDGSPVGLGHKNSYPPNTDAVQEVIVSTNSVDAESGHSAGGQISMTTKSGTNEWHGTGFYLGRYPWASAATDRTTFNYTSTRQHMMGGTLGNPILKNKLFNFFSLEYWKVSNPNSYSNTMPTELEKNGDFSQSYYLDGGNSGIRTVYDPYTTVLNNTTGAVTVTPFAGNKIPTSRFDPLTGSLMKQFWAGNNAGDNITGVNNYRKSYIETYNYYNYSERADYNLNDKWKFFGRVGRYHTTDISGNPTGGTSDLYVPTGTLRAAWQVSGDAIWTATSRTVLSFHGDWHNVIDAYVSPDMGKDGWSKIWPNNDWYKTYQDAAVGVPVYFPHMAIGGTGVGGGGFYWDQRPGGQAYNVKISHQAGSHFLKAGIEHRRSYGLSYVSSTSNFNFPTYMTAETYTNANTLRNGDQFATFLLGTLDGSSQMIGGPSPDNHTEFYGMYFQDDWKVNRRITLNLGLRNDYETAWHDPKHLFSQGMDLNATVPEMAANPVAVPGAVSDIVGTNYWKNTGMWSFTSSSHPGMWDAPKLALQPRAGLAFRIDDLTSLRFGYARYTIPTEYNMDIAPGFETVSFLEPPFFGQTGYQNTLGQLAGIPQQTFSDPFPAGKNPLLPIKGNGYGSNLGRGGQTLLWYNKNFQKPWNDRINISFQRQLPKELVVSATFFMNFGHQLYVRNYNAMDPAIKEKYQNSLSATVANPYYNYLTQDLFPSGSLRSQQTVTLSSLLKPYPQYGDLFQAGTCCAGERYNSLELKLQKAFSKGYNFLAAYVYVRERSQQYLGSGNGVNDANVFYNQMIWQDSDQSRHHFTAAGTYEVPIGRGRMYLSKIPKAADFLVGGWKLTAMGTFLSGSYPRFGNLLVTGNPCVANPTREHWFNTAAFSQIPANTYVLRTNPFQYDCLKSPTFQNIDATLSKTFNITEKVHTEFKMNAYNALNKLNLGSPNTDITSSQFGTSLFQGSPGGTYGAGQGASTYSSGRQIELGLKIIF
jgi:hypothetical protein